MPQFYFSVNRDNRRRACIAPLSNRLIEQSGQQIDDPSGYFLFEVMDNESSDAFEEVEIIAQMVSEEAAFRLKEILGMS